MSINIDIPDRKTMIPKIAVLGVGGAGGNAVNNMINLQLQGVNFVVANTDAQALSSSKADLKLQLGENITKGLGAGSSPEVGVQAVEESKDEILSHLSDCNMVFITAGMGGGTGTGAAPMIAKICRENNILTVGVVTKPFHFEGSYRMKTAEAGVLEMQKYVDTLIVIPNQNLFHKATEKTTFAEAFNMVDQVLYSGIKGITDLMTMPGLINLDFADIRAIMGNMGKAVMGTGEANGEKRALDAAESAISNPLLDHTSMKGAKGVLINISGGLDMTLFEADEAAQRVKDEVDPDANIIFGSTFDKDLDGKIRVSVVATGIDIINDEAQKSSYNNQSDTNVVKHPTELNITKSDDRVSINNIENSFIPPEVVDPQSLEKLETQANHNNAEISESQNVVSLEEKIKREEINQVNTPNQFTAQNNHDIKQAVGGENFLVQNPLDTQGHNSNISQDNGENKSGKLGGIFNFFKDLQNGDNKDIPVQEKHIEENSQSVNNNNQHNNDSNNEDLTLSDDILNVPTFIRNKNEQN